MLGLSFKRAVLLGLVSTAAGGCFQTGPACTDELRIDFSPAVEGVGLHELEVSTVSDGDVTTLNASCTYSEPENWLCTGQGLSTNTTGTSLVSIVVIGRSPDELRVAVYLEGELQREQSFSPEYSIADYQRECRQAIVTMTE